MSISILPVMKLRTDKYRCEVTCDRLQNRDPVGTWSLGIALRHRCNQGNKMIVFTSVREVSIVCCYSLTWLYQIIHLLSM